MPDKSTSSERATVAAPETPAKPVPLPGGTPADINQLIQQAIQEFDDYQRLTAEGKLGEAGQKLEQHKRTLAELKRVGKPK